MSDWPANAFGIAGLKNTGKTTLVERLVLELSSRGLRVATLKHAHHNFAIDHEGTDSHRHRMAGSVETIICSANQIVQMANVTAPEPSLRSLLDRLGEHDIALVEGWKRDDLPKLMLLDDDTETHYPGTIATVSKVTAIAHDLPKFQRDDIDAMADFLIACLPAETSQ